MKKNNQFNKNMFYRNLCILDKNIKFFIFDNSSVEINNVYKINNVLFNGEIIKDRNRNKMIANLKGFEIIKIKNCYFAHDILKIYLLYNNENQLKKIIDLLIKEFNIDKSIVDLLFKKNIIKNSDYFVEYLI